MLKFILRYLANYLDKIWEEYKANTVCVIPQLLYFVKHFFQVPPAVRLILQLQCSPIGNRSFQKNIATEGTPHSVLYK